MEQYLVEELIRLAFKEDVGEGDHTTLAILPSYLKGKAQLILKEEGILAGVRIAEQIFRIFDQKLEIQIHIKDGSEVKSGEIAFTVAGNAQSLLQTERLVLNIMQHMSGIATVTHQYVEQLKGTNARILDTRKTSPGIRIFEKEAVRIGGGENHRMGLFDMILLKDNHIDFAGGIKKAIFYTKKYLLETNIHLPIEIEVRSFEELEEVLQIGGIDRILLDNFNLEQTHQAVKQVNGKYPLESSGRITYDTIRQYAETGVDYISIGALTHSVKSLDMSLKAIF